MKDRKKIKKKRKKSLIATLILLQGKLMLRESTLNIPPEATDL